MGIKTYKKVYSFIHVDFCWFFMTTTDDNNIWAGKSGAAVIRVVCIMHARVEFQLRPMHQWGGLLIFALVTTSQRSHHWPVSHTWPYSTMYFYRLPLLSSNSNSLVTSHTDFDVFIYLIFFVSQFSSVFITNECYETLLQFLLKLVRCRLSCTKFKDLLSASIVHYTWTFLTFVVS